MALALFGRSDRLKNKVKRAFVIEVIAAKFNIATKNIVTYSLVLVETILAFAAGFGFIALGIGGGAWILGGIAAGALAFYIYRARFSDRLEPNRNLRKLGQMIVGLTVGFSIQPHNLEAITAQLPIFVFLALFLLASGGLIAYIYSRLQKTDLLTATLATVPGNIGIMASLAADYGKSTALVSLVQLIRFTTLISAIPLIANVSHPYDIHTAIATLTQDLFKLNLTYLLLLVLVLSLTALVVSAAGKLKIPVAAFLGSIVVGIALNFSFAALPLTAQMDFSFSPLFKVIGQILLGITIGEYWGLNPKFSRATIAYALVPVILTFFAGLLSAGIAMLLTPWDWLTCLLVTAPGGSPEMIWIALVLHHDVEIVTAGHLVRLIAINFSLPALVSLACYLEERLSNGVNNPAPVLESIPAANPTSKQR
nr:AbrB family transcriptional regulator [Trichocoleus sp. FACHB-591]